MEIFLNNGNSIKLVKGLGDKYTIYTINRKSKTPELLELIIKDSEKSILISKLIDILFYGVTYKFENFEGAINISEAWEPPHINNGKGAYTITTINDNEKKSIKINITDEDKINLIELFEDTLKDESLYFLYNENINFKSFNDNIVNGYKCFNKAYKLEKKIFQTTKIHMKIIKVTPNLS
jgi:hypothetical protein